MLRNFYFKLFPKHTFPLPTFIMPFLIILDEAGRKEVGGWGGYQDQWTHQRKDMEVIKLTSQVHRKYFICLCDSVILFHLGNSPRCETWSLTWVKTRIFTVRSEVGNTQKGDQENPSQRREHCPGAGEGDPALHALGRVWFSVGNILLETQEKPWWRQALWGGLVQHPSSLLYMGLPGASGDALSSLTIVFHTPPPHPLPCNALCLPGFSQPSSSWSSPLWGLPDCTCSTSSTPRITEGAESGVAFKK